MTNNMSPRGKFRIQVKWLASAIIKNARAFQREAFRQGGVRPLPSWNAVAHWRGLGAN